MFRLFRLVSYYRRGELLDNLYSLEECRELSDNID